MGAEAPKKALTNVEKERVVRQNLTKDDRIGLYQASRFLDGETRDRIGMRLPCTVYVQDPEVAKAHPELGRHEIGVRWEPGLGAGPTSARLAVVDYDVDTGAVQPPAVWCQETFAFCGADCEPVAARPESPQFRQVNVWAQVQRALEYYEDPRALGRPIPWGFEGNRLLVVPHAGYQNNAYYDRKSKSLQFYYYGDRRNPSYTCLSHDIVAHETGHAILDGIRPRFLDNSSWETAAFHEFLGDLTAILLTLRNNEVRQFLKNRVGTNLAKARILFRLAEEFGRHVQDRPFLRTARNRFRYADAAATRTAHDASQVLTGAMFDVLVRIARQYLTPKRQAERKRPATPARALWWAIDGAAGIALQPLDLLPPADVRFADYARAVLRNHEITDPADRYGYRPLMSRVFHRRGLCGQEETECRRDPKNCALAAGDPPELDVFPSIGDIARSRTAAYNFLHDNRRRLGIPDYQDFVVADLYDANKYGRGVERLPRQVVVQYLWREAVPLEGPEFGKLQGKKAELPCGGTLVFDDRGNLLSWAFKRGRGTREGDRRYQELREHVARQLATRRLGLQDDLDAAVPAGPAQPPVVAREVGGLVRLETAPHGCALDDESEEETWTTRFF